MPGDDPTLEWRAWNGMQVLAHKENGDCVHLGKKGCKVHARRPEVCRVFDCRKFVLASMQGIGLASQVKKDPEVVKAGMERMRTLTEEDCE
jgi:Fe-S-cluster containining protein